MRIIDCLKLEMRNLDEPSKEEFSSFEEQVIRHNFRISGLDRPVIQDDEDLYDYDRDEECEEDDEEDYDFYNG